jgi:mono/diheme cytochrome c family protein
VRRIIMTLVVLAAAGAAGFWLLTMPELQRAGLEPLPSRAADVANGEVLFHAGGCASCHATPGQPDKLRLGGGVALHTPFGTFHGPNISPHPTDGIGGWTPEQFVRAMRGGVSPSGQHYYPAFPYTSYQRMPAADVADVFAYIRTLPAMAGRAPEHDLPFPYSVRRGLGLWKLAFLDGRVFTPDPARTAEINRGAYLVEGPGHCAECHSPRNLLGAKVAGQRFAGGPDPEGKGFTPNITPHPTGIGGWSVDELATLLETGETPLFITVGGSMGSVVNNTARLPAADRRAMGAYLLTLPPLPSAGKPQRQGALPAAIPR